MKLLEIDERGKNITVTVGPDECLLGALWGSKEWYYDALSEIFPQKINEQYLFLIGYMANDAEDIYERIGKMMTAVQLRTPGVEMTKAENRRAHILIALIRGTEQSISEYLDSIEECMLHSRWKEETVWVSRTFFDMQEGYDVFWKAYGELKYGLTFGSGCILRDLDEKSLMADEIDYPVSLERQLGAAVGSSDKKKCVEITKSFQQQVMQGTYWPDDIRYVAGRLMQHMRKIVKESNVQAYYELKSQNMEERILNANSRRQLSEIMEQVCEIVCDVHGEKRNSNYNINRALEYVRLHYSEGITLKETAEALDITPEYLSMLFKREVGINFSVFLKRFRISHAKRLLMGTDMKVREVAEACGYSNSNYFIKVFREVTGTVPTEFR